MWVSDHLATPYGVQWMRFDSDCPLPELVKTVPHVAFEVDDLDAAISGKHVIICPNEPSDGVRVAFIEEAGAPIELLQITSRSDDAPKGMFPAPRPRSGAAAPGPV